MLGSRVILAVVGGGAAAAVAAAAAAVRAGRARAELSRVATAELRLHGFIDLSVFLLALGFRVVLVSSAPLCRLGTVPFVNALAAASFSCCSRHALQFW